MFYWFLPLSSSAFYAISSRLCASQQMPKRNLNEIIETNNTNQLLNRTFMNICVRYIPYLVLPFLLLYMFWIRYQREAEMGLKRNANSFVKKRFHGWFMFACMLSWDLLTFPLILYNTSVRLNLLSLIPD